MAEQLLMAIAGRFVNDESNAGGGPETSPFPADLTTGNPVVPAAGVGSERDDAFADRVLGELGDRVQVELAHDVAAVHLDGRHRDVQLFGDRR